MATTDTDTIRVVAYREGDAWVAQCLEYDIFAQGADFNSAMRRLNATVNLECKHTRKTTGTAFGGIDPAPTIFETMFEAAQQSMTSDNYELRIAA